MHFITNICFMCLRRTPLMTPVNLENGVLQKFKYVCPEMVAVDTQVQRNVCKVCYTAVNSFYSFKKRSIRSYNRWLGYIGLLQGNFARDKFGDIQIRIYKGNNSDNIDEDFCFDEPLPVVEENQQQEQKVDVNQQHNQQELDDKIENIQLNEYNTCEDSDDDSKLIIDEDRILEIDSKLVIEDNQINIVPKANSNYEECYYCPICKKYLPTKICLTRHYTQMHVRGQDSVTCPLCFKTCKSYFLKHHFRTHISKALECPICKKQLFKRVSLKSHLKNVHKCSLYNVTCALCDEDCFGLEMYEQHLQSNEHLDKVREANMLQNGADVKLSLDDVKPQINKENLGNVENVPMEVASN